MPYQCGIGVGRGIGSLVTTIIDKAERTTNPKSNLQWPTSDNNGAILTVIKPKSNTREYPKCP